MGMIRKTMSVSTLGLVDFRSDKERTAKYTKRSMKEAKKQTAMMHAALPAQLITAQATWQTAQVVTAAAVGAVSPTPAPGPAAGWYADPRDANQIRWFDGQTWTEFAQPAPSTLTSSPQAGLT